ncbi:MAG TPA: preprotein translocase subunit SecA [bacterium]|nr:preprotein translocase subunit SecA [bacterium]HOL47100.1 preprotein translocase subunit SecA [bacterium]HPQ18854.1 preprotein translocase subunit SecA [bacterium]
MFKIINNLLIKIFGSKQERDIKKLQPIVKLVNYCEWLFFDKDQSFLVNQIKNFREKISKNELDESYFNKLKEKLENKFNELKNFNEQEIKQARNFLKEEILNQKKRITEENAESKFLKILLSNLSDENIEKILNNFEIRLTNIINELKNNFDGIIDEINECIKTYVKNNENFEELDFILFEVFAIVRIAAERTLGMRHFDVQIMGGVVLHKGKIAEMKTGEGKTLVATLALALNALLNKGSYLVTVNDYLAERDSIWMGEIYKYIGLSVGLILNYMGPRERKIAYQSDITYGTNNEFGFDYLRDNIVISPENIVQREDFYYAIVDEVDSILIDEARTPLIISAPAEESTQKYYIANRLVSHLKEGKIIQEGEEKKETGDYIIDEKNKNVTLTEAGIHKCEKLLNLDNLYSPKNMDLVHHIIQAIRAHKLFKRDVDYIIKDGEVVIVDEFTGRIMPGRRWSDGLHQAVEAKENIKIKEESITLATITLQNYFRMFKKLAGMTGTADTEAEEFKEIYKLDVVVIPTNKPMIRVDEDDAIYRTEKEKFDAVINLIVELHKIGRPVLVGTISIEKSEKLSSLLKQKGIKHFVLNAKHHAQEAEIIARAGEKGSVTISTNMAGRGTDIILGKEVAELGGLYVIGTERHESRRIDNQLRGRAGRQGDPGTTKFFVSLEDDLMRIFGSDRISPFLQKLGFSEGQELQHPWLSKAIAKAQSRVEAYNFDIRKHLIEFDDVMNKQREIIYNERKKALFLDSIKDYIIENIKYLIEDAVNYYCDDENEIRDYDSFEKELFTIFNNYPNVKKDEFERLRKDEIIKRLEEQYISIYNIKRQNTDEHTFNNIEKFILLNTVDEHWKDHLTNIDYLKEGIHLRGYASIDPIVAYKNEAHQLFEDMIYKIKKTIIENIFRLSIIRNEELTFKKDKNIMISHNNINVFSNANIGEKTEQQVNKKQAVVTHPTKIEKIGRNELCPCGSGKKYKKCCGKNE